MSKKEGLSPHFGILLSIAAFELAFHWKKEKDICNYKLYGIIWPLSIFLKACRMVFPSSMEYILALTMYEIMLLSAKKPAVIILWSKAWFLSNSRIIAHAIFFQRDFVYIIERSTGYFFQSKLAVFQSIMLQRLDIYLLKQCIRLPISQYNSGPRAKKT